MRIIKSYTMIVLIGIAVVGLTITTARAATLDVDFSGNDPVFPVLLGATGVNVTTVQGVFIGEFDVRFEEGSCETVFAPCDFNTVFAFNDIDSALAAGIALLDQVFVNNHPDAPLALFDSRPNLTAGCESTSNCIAFIPYAVVNFPCCGDDKFVQLQTGSNNFIEANDGAGGGTALTAAVDHFGITGTYAVFTPAAVIPLPPAAFLFGSGLVVLAGIRRRRQAQRD